MDTKKEFKDLLIQNELGDLFSIPQIEELKTLSSAKRRIIPTDYAQACGAMADTTQNTKKIRYGIYFYEDDKRHIGSATIPLVSSNGILNYTDVDSTNSVLTPRLTIDIDRLLNSSFVDKYKIDPINKTIEFNFLVFPQTIAQNSEEIEQAFLSNPDNFKATGRTYSGRIINTTAMDCLTHNKEYLVGEERYVRVKVKNAAFIDHSPVFSNGKNYDNGQYIWCKVNPIVWEIDNWDSLPAMINKNSIILPSTSTRMKIHTSQGIMGGIPFYPISSKDSKFCELYQNSFVRAYLNSINIYASLESDRSKFKYRAPLNFNFIDNGFLDEICLPQIETQLDYSTQGEYNLIFDNTPLSIKEQLQFYINTGKSFMLHGPSGVGKTRRIQELDPNCICLQLRDGLLPEEIIGKTAYDGKKAEWIPPTWYTRLQEICQKEPDKKHVLFIDELTNVHENEQSLVFHIVLEHSIDGNIGKLPDNCVVVAAGNNPEESEAAYNMPEPLFRRFEGHIYLQPNLASFLEWGSELGADGNPKIHPIVAEFLASNKGNAFYSKYDPDAPPKFAIDPRGWEQISKIIYDNKGTLRFELLASKVGEDIARDLISFAKMPKITIADIMKGKIKTSLLPQDRDAKYAFTGTLRSANEQQVAKVRKFIETYLGREYLAYFDSMWTENNIERTLLIGELDELENSTNSYKTESSNKEGL